MKKFKNVLLTILCLFLVTGATGCALLDDTLNDIKGDLAGNGYTIRTYDNYGEKVMTTVGDKINIKGNPVKTTSYDSDGSVITGYEMSSVITINIDGKEIKMTIGVILEKYGVAPMIINDRTYVPIRFVAEELGAEVQWNEETKTVTIIKDNR